MLTSLVQIANVVVAISVVFSTSKLTSAESDKVQHSPVVQTESGSVVGKIESLPHGKSVHEYLGIPYAEPPVGDLRFAAPKPVKPWSGTREATEYGAQCPQPWVPFVGTEEEREDCLSLNVFVPSTVKPDDKLAVMVWIHGGGFTMCSSSWFPGSVLSAFNDVIVVTLNYRLGILGFFYYPDSELKGNYGMMDQILALKWIQANIANFGGDSNRVTIFGESAGGISVSLHLISPLSEGLFRRIIVQSGSASTPFIRAKAKYEKSLEFAKRMNCTSSSEVVKCLKDKTIHEIIQEQSNYGFPRPGIQDITSPVVDGDFLPDLPENCLNAGKFHKDVDVMTGFNSQDGAITFALLPPSLSYNGTTPEAFREFVRDMAGWVREKNKLIDEAVIHEYTDHTDPQNRITVRQMMMDLTTDAFFAAPLTFEATILAKRGRAPYVYLFNHRPVHTAFPEWMGVVHGIEQGFVFGAPHKSLSSFLATIAPKYSEMEQGLSWYIMKLWSDFAKYGNPTPPSSGALVTWPQYSAEDQSYLVLDLEPRVEHQYRADKMSFWIEFIPKLMKQTVNEEEETENSNVKDEL